MRGTLGGGKKIREQFVSVTSGPKAIRASRNLLLLVGALGQIEPAALLNDLTRAVPKAFSGQRRRGQTTGANQTGDYVLDEQ